MTFKFAHTNINVLDMERSIKFYSEALGLRELRAHTPADGSFKIVYLTDGEGRYQLELTWLANRAEPYDLSDNEIHIAFAASDFEAALEKHRAMGVVCMENPAMGIYFIEDPDGYWVEIVASR